MSASSSLSELAALTDMLYRAEQAKLREIVAKEATLRRDLARLDENRRRTMHLPDDQLTNMRHIGADLQWQAWLGRSREELNRQLALCLAQKARMLTALRRAHGRKLASDEILKNDQDARAIRRQKHADSAQDTLSMIRHISAVRQG